jgi:SAM-dependent methyltransferase
MRSSNRFFRFIHFILFDLFRVIEVGEILRRMRGIPHYLRNLRQFRRMNSSDKFLFRVTDANYRTFDKFCNAGTASGYYFFQDLWAAKRLYQRGVRRHVDVASRIDGFVAHILPFAQVEYVDVRPLRSSLPELKFIQGSITDLPFETDSVPSLSCLNVIEHIGLGRYGDPVDPEGHVKAANDLARILQPGGELLLGTPVGRERLVFDAHRVFDPQTIIDLFSSLELLEFSFIDDNGDRIIESPDFEECRRADCGCGLFVFRKPVQRT